MDKLTGLVEFISGLATDITGVWTSITTSAGGIIVFVSAGCAVIGYAISGLWRMFSKRKRGARG